jgi:uncharacterized coiled-coil DUF342 family protein
MAVMAPRESWTDQHLNELSNRTDEGFRELRAEIASLRGEVGELRAELGEVREGLGEVRAEIKGINRTLQVGFGLIGAVLTGILGLIAAQLATQV